MAAKTRKKFTPRHTTADTPPLEFEIYDEVFQAVPRLQGAVIIDFIGASASVEEDQTALTKSIIPFFQSALFPESYDRFTALIRSQDKVVEVDELMEILSWLISEYTARPTDGSVK